MSPLPAPSFFFFNDSATTEIYTLSLHDALPICGFGDSRGRAYGLRQVRARKGPASEPDCSRAHAWEHSHSHRHGARPRDRRGDRVLGGHRDDLRLARHRPADHLLDQCARPTRDRGLSHDDGLPGDPDQFARRPPLFRARSSRALRGGAGMTALTEETHIDTDSAVEAPLRRILVDFLASKLAVAGLAALAAIVFVSLLAPWISPQNPYDLAALNLLDGRLPPGSASADGGITHWLGTDDQGRDMLSAIFYGLRTSLMVGVLSAGF